MPVQTPPTLVLASSSPYRRSLLQRLALPFTWASPAIDESPLPGEAIVQLTQRLAQTKAQALSSQFPQALLIGSDQACAIEGSSQILGKPGNFAAAEKQLVDCSGKTVCFHTSLVLLNSQTQQLWRSHDEYRVHFRALNADEISYYLQQEQPYDCAGSFKAEGLGITLFQSLEGKDFHSLIGLPLLSLCELLRQAGVDPLQAH
jgi:septum formation protein